MSLYDYFNSFSRYIEAERPPDKAIVLYWALLDMFNRRDWPEWAVADNLQLTLMCNTTSIQTAKRARDTLCAAGFLEYVPGEKKGQLTRYRLLISSQYAKKGYKSIPQSEPQNVPEADKGVEKGYKSVPQNEPQNAVILIKTKTGDFLSSSFSKTKTTTPTTGTAATDWSSSASSDSDREVMARFLEFLPGRYCRKPALTSPSRAVNAVFLLFVCASTISSSVVTPAHSGQYR